MCFAMTMALRPDQARFLGFDVWSASRQAAASTSLERIYKKSVKTEMIDWYLRFPAGGHAATAYDPARPDRVRLVEDFWT
jgi:hypothetical protein